jgi:hypothetical protein
MEINGEREGIKDTKKKEILTSKYAERVRERKRGRKRF